MMFRVLAVCTLLLSIVPHIAQAQLRGHGGPVRALAISPDGTQAVSGSFDTSAIRWSLPKNAAEQVLRFHDGAVNAAAFLTDGRIATSGEDARIAIWTPGAPQPSMVLAGHTAPVVALSVSPDGTTLASASWDHTARLWPLGGGAPRLIEGHAQNVNGVAFAPDGRALVTAGYDATLRISPLLGGGAPVITTLPTPLNAVAVAPDGEIVTAGADGKVYVLSAAGEVTGEIEAAAAGTLPALVQQSDLLGDLHTHSDWSDGRTDIRTMGLAAQQRGYRYMALTDHTQSLLVAGGLTPERFRLRAAEIARVNRELIDFRILAGAEVDILADGRLDLPDEVLESLDLVVASVHTAFDQSRAVMTERVVRALRSPHVDVLGHPTCRRLDRREGTAVDLEAVIAEAARSGTALEINSSPMRLDLNDTWARQALAAGVLLAVDNDAHYPAEFGYARYGSAIARRAGAGVANVLNTRSADELLAHCRQRTARVAG